MTNAVDVAPLGGGNSAIEPPIGSDIDLRENVAKQLRDAAGCVVVVDAPPGYGKTTTLAAWSRRDGRPVAWIDMEVWHNEPAALLEALADALGRVSDFDASALPTVKGSRPQYTTLIIPTFARLVSRCTAAFILVVDDAHRLVDPTSLEILTALTSHVPTTSTVVLAGRATPEVPLARQRSRGQVIDLTASDLAMDVPAAKQLVASMGVSLDEDDVAALVRATEGWPVGLRLAATALRDDADDMRRLSARRLGHDEHVAAYVREEWLRGIEPDERTFLREASWLGSLSPELCDRALERSDSGTVLQRLHTDRRLVIPLSRRGNEYRMHRLLRTVLLAESERTPPARRQHVLARASHWCEERDDIDRAIEYALGAGDRARTEMLVGIHGGPVATVGRHGTLQRWIDSLPRTQVVASARLCLMSAVASLGLGESDTTLAWLDLAERNAARTPDDRETWAMIIALRSVTLLDIDPDDLTAAADAWSTLQPGPWHALASLGYGQLSFAVGDTARAIDLFALAAREAAFLGNVTIEAQSLGALAAARWEGGDVAEATVVARAARTVVRDHHLDHLSTVMLATGMSSLVEAAAGNVDDARADMDLTRRNLPYVASVASYVNVESRIAIARTSLLLGDRVSAKILIDEAERVLREGRGWALPRAQVATLAEQVSVGRQTLPMGPSSLTTAELRVLHYLPTNLTLSEIARRLYVSRNTAKSHAASVYRKLGVSSRSQAVDVAREVGLLAPGVADSLPA